MATAKADSAVLTSHVLDTAAGRPAEGVRIELFRLDGEEVVELELLLQLQILARSGLSLADHGLLLFLDHEVLFRLLSRGGNKCARKDGNKEQRFHGKSRIGAVGAGVK